MGRQPTASVPSFNPRTPAGCDKRSNQDHFDSVGFQSTHPCGVRLVHSQRGIQHHGVSIHAPLRGATCFTFTVTANLTTFQSTHPCGVRRWPTSELPSGGEVSIHAPLRGATSLHAAIEALRDGADPGQDGWESDLPDGYTAQRLYDELTSREYGWQIIADDAGVYPERMGAAGRIVFGLND